MTSLDKLYGKGTSAESRKKSGLDALFEEREESIIKDARMLDAEAIVLEKQAAVLERQQKVDNLRSRAGPVGSPMSGGFGPEGANTAIELIKILTKQGMELQKATEYVANMDQDTMMKLAMISGSPGGMNQLLPFILMSKKDSVTPADMAEISKTYFEMGKGVAAAVPQTSWTEIANAVNTLRPKSDDSGIAQYFEEKFERIEEKLEAEREARHQADIAHAQEMAATRQQMNDDRFKAMEAKLAEAQTGGGKPKTAVETIEESVALVNKVKELGGDAAAKTPMQELNGLVETVVNAPGMVRVFDAGAQAIRDRARGGAQRPATQVPTAGQNFFCDVCLAQGKRTVLTMTPELVAGTGTVKCPTCGKEFMNQRGRGGGGGDTQGQQGNQGQPPGPPAPFFPGKF